MRAPLLAFLLLTSACGGPPAETPAVITAVPVAPSASAAPTAKIVVPPADPVTFTKRTPVVGDKREEEEKSDVQVAMTINIAGAPPSRNDVTSHETKKKSVEALAVKGDAVTKVRVTYREVTRTAAEEIKSAISGKTYVVDSAGGKITVNDSTGKRAKPDEAQEVEKDFSHLGKPDPIVASLPTTPIVPGTRIDSMATAFVDYFEREKTKAAMKITNASVSFRGQEGDEGLFDIGFTLSTGEDPVLMTADLRGTFRLRVKTAQPTKMEITGPISFSPGNNPDMSIAGTGVMTISSVTK